MMVLQFYNVCVGGEGGGGGGWCWGGVVGGGGGCVERVSWRGCVCWEDVCGGYDVSWRGCVGR